MPIRTDLEIPKTEARHRWAINILAGLDLESTLGLPNQATDLTVLGSNGDALPTLGGSAGLGKLLPVGTVESLDVGQSRAITQRIGFNANPLQPFQTVPHGALFTLKLSRVVLKKMPEVEASFQFLPSNLLLQQLPFVIDMTDVGDGDPSTFTRHLIFGCWFADSNVKYDVIDRDNTKLIQSVTIMCGRSITFDQSFAGSQDVQLKSAVTGVLFQAAQTNAATKNLLEDYELG
jgi:hypothetical protein